MKFLTPIILIIISFGLLYFFVNPEYQKIQTARASLTEYNNAIDRTKAASQQRNVLVERYNSFSTENLNRLQTLLPDKIDNIRLLVDVNQISSKYSGGINNIRITTTDDSNGGVAVASNNSAYGTLNLTFTVKASYSDFQKLISELETSLRIMDITNIAFTNSTVDQTTYTVTLKTYWLR